MEILWKGPFVNLLGWHLAQIVAVNFVGDDESQSFSAATSIVRVPKQDQRFAVAVHSSHNSIFP